MPDENFFRYILLHEIGHVLSRVNGFFLCEKENAKYNFNIILDELLADRYAITTVLKLNGNNILFDKLLCEKNLHF